MTNGITRGSQIEGIDYGISYQENEEGSEVLVIYPEISFHLSAAAIKNYKAVCGTYTVEAVWREDGQQYAAETKIVVTPGKVLSKIYWMDTDENGVIDYLSAEDSEAVEGLKIYYSAFKTYTEDVWDEDTETEFEKEITETYIYTDSDVNGIFEFIGVDTTDYENAEALSSVFAKGTPFAFDSETNVTPLVIHRQKITTDMVGKAFTLQFKNNQTFETVVATIENEDGDISLEENKLYAIGAGRIANIDLAGNIKFHNKADLQELIQTCVEMKEDEGIRYVFAVYSDGKLQAEKLDTENENEYVQIISIDDYEYVLQGLQLGECVLYAQDDENLSISCKVGLPECGAYASRERSENTYLGDEFHFISAKQKKSDDSAAYFYVMTPKYTWGGINSQSELTASLADYDDTKDSWEPENEEGISFAQDGTYTDMETGNTYYVWKATVQKEYVNDQKIKHILVRGNPGTDSESGETYYRYEKVVALKIYDSAEIPEEEQLYWVDSYRCNLSEGGKLVPVEEGDDFGRWNKIEEPWDYGACLTKGYLAIRQTENGEAVYYAMKQISIPEELKDSITCADETGFLYNIEYNVLGSYRISAEYEDQQYSANIVTKLPYIGFYKTENNSVENENLIGHELYFNALAQSEDGTEAYFYVITGEPVYGSEIKTNDWYEDGKEITVKGLSFEDLGELENGCHIWKATLNRDSFKTSEFDIAVGDTESWIKIYDASTKTKEEQIYWIENYYVESISETNGQIEDTDEYYFKADQIDASLRWNTKGYFAIFENDRYYAVNPTTLPDGINKSAKNDYLYEIDPYTSQKYEIKYDDGKQIRTGTFRLDCSGMELFSSPEIRKESLLHGKAKFKALPKDEAGNAYFYVIASELGQNPRMAFREWVIDEDGNETMEEVESVTGLSISESYETVSYGEQKLLAWKVTIDKDSYTPQNGYEGRDIFIAGDEGTCSYYATIYSNTYEEPPEQLYWFNDDGNIQLDSGGIISLKDDRNENEENVELEWFSYSKLNRTLYGYASGSMQGYFAILKDGQYQAVDIVCESYSWISKSGDTPHLYEIGVPTEAVITQIIYVDGEEKYAIDYRYSLPTIGLSSDKDNLWTNYIESEDIWLENLPKDGDGYRYIYVYEREDWYSEENADQIPEGRAYYVENDGAWTDVTEITLEKVGFSAQEYAGEKYFVFKALIPEDFEWDEDRELKFECPAQGSCVRVRIHDKYTVKEDDQLYIVPAYTVESVADDGKMVIANEWNVRKKAELTV